MHIFISIIIFLFLVTIEETEFIMAFSNLVIIKVPLWKANSTYLMFSYDKDFKSEANKIFMADKGI